MYRKNWGNLQSCKAAWNSTPMFGGGGMWCGMIQTCAELETMLMDPGSKIINSTIWSVDSAAEGPLHVVSVIFEIALNFH
jgi:hypothetical protein